MTQLTPKQAANLAKFKRFLRRTCVVALKEGWDLRRAKDALRALEAVEIEGEEAIERLVAAAGKATGGQGCTPGPE